MSPHIATILCAIFILGLFLLDRNRTAKTSKALWLPTIWVSLAASRLVSGWFRPASQATTAQQYIEGNPLDRAILTGLLILGLIVLISRSRRVFSVLRMNGPMLLFFSYCALSILWSPYPDVAFKRWIKAVGDLVMILIVLTDRDRTASIKRLLSRVGYLLIPLSVLFILYYPSLGQSYSLEDMKPMYIGVTVHKNELGMLCLLIGLASVWRLIYVLRDRSHRVRNTVMHGAILAMVLWLLVVANSATSLACFLLGSALIVSVRMRGRERTKWVHLVVGSVAFLALFMVFLPDAYAYFVHALGRNTTLTDRTKLWQVLLSTNTDPWFGTGYASFWLGNRLERLWSLFNGWQPNETHNGYLGVWLNLGWVGMTIFALFLATGYRNVVAAFRRNPEVGSLRIGIFVVALVYNFTEDAFRMMVPMWIFLLWSILAVPEAQSRMDSIVIEPVYQGQEAWQDTQLVAEAHMAEEVG